MLAHDAHLNVVIEYICMCTCIYNIHTPIVYMYITCQCKLYVGFYNFLDCIRS